MGKEEEELGKEYQEKEREEEEKHEGVVEDDEKTWKQGAAGRR